MNVEQSPRRMTGRLSSVAGALLVIIGILAGEAGAQAAAEPVALTADWSIRRGDSPRLPDGRFAWLDESASSGWEHIPALAIPPGNNPSGILWLRIELPTGDWPDPTLFAGSISGAFEVYSNGQLVGAGGEIHPGGEESSRFSVWTMVPLTPASLGHPVFFRIQTTTGANPGIQRTLKLGARADLSEAIVRSGLPSFIIAALTIVLALLSAFGAFRAGRGTRPVLLAAAAFFLTSGTLVLSLGDLAPLVWNHPEAWNRVLLLSAALFAPVMGLFIAVTFASPEARWFRQFTNVNLGVAALLAVAIMLDPYAVSRHSPAFILLILGGLGTNCAAAFIEARRGNYDARALLAGVLGMLLVVMYDSLPTLGIGTGGAFHTYLGVSALSMALFVIVIRRLVMLQKTLEAHARQLEDRHKTVREISEKLAKGAHELIGAVQKLRASSAQQNQGLTQQSVSVQEVQATAGEIHQTSQLAAEKANTTMTNTADADEVSRIGAAALEKSLGGLQAIQTEVADMAQRVISLGSRTREIVTIVETVKDLADQSNILALNAAIEATRAGEHGKGFAVVAREVRRLADQSIQSTVRIREILAGISDGIRDAATLSERGELRVRQSLEQVQASGDQLRKLSELMRETSNTVRQIAAAVSQQNAGISQFFIAINELSDQATETLDLLKETEAATTLVERVANEMATLVMGPEQPVPQERAA